MATYLVATPAQIKYYGPNGASETITLSYANYTVSPTETAPFLAAIELADGTTYQFTYSSVPSVLVPSDTSYGIGSVTLPTGGQISYSTQGGIPPQGAGTYTTTFTRTTSDGKTTYVSTATQNAHQFVTSSMTTITRPDQSEEVIHFMEAQGPTGPSYLETAHTWLNASGGLLKSNMRCYNGKSGNCITSAITLPITQITNTTTLDSGQVSKAVRTLNASALTTELDGYDLEQREGSVGATGHGRASAPSSVDHPTLPWYRTSARSCR